MSLQVWLPLNGDLHNQGLNGAAAITTNSATVNANGKIGSCYLFDGTSNYMQFSNFNMDSLLGFSIACWIKPATDSIGGLFLVRSSSTHRIRLDDSGLTFRDTKNSNQRSIPWNHTFIADKWVHVCTVYKQGEVFIYCDGELTNHDTSYYHSDGQTNTSNTEIRIGRSQSTSGNVYFNGSINDFRIYDHTLSAKEVKEIAKGLMLHYKLNDKYAEPTQNLITTADCLSSTCYNGATSKYSYGTTTNMYKEVTTFDGHHGTKVYMGTNGDPAFPYVYVNGMFTSDGTNQPAYKTLSFDYYSNISTSIRAYKLGSGNGTATYRLTNSNGISTGTGNDAVSIPIISNEWNHVEITFHGTTAANSEWGYIQNYPSHTSNTNNFWFFSNMQLETKDHATGYAGVGGIRSNGVVYDSSGYQYDAVLIGETTIRAGDSARYDAYAYFNGSSGSTIKCNTNKWMIQGTEQLTINFWAKAITWSTNGGRLISCTESGGWNLEGGNSGYWRFPVHVYTDAAKSALAYKYDSKEIKISDLIANEWNMITLVYDAAQGTKTYINGELHHTYNNVSYGIHYNTNVRLYLGCEAAGSPTTPYFVGQESDFRIYATVLSAEDIKELYNTSASIDNKGNIYAREVIEI